MNRFLQVVMALIPLLLTPVLIYGLAEGVLDFGGGEKDVLVALPWMIWSLVFALVSFILIYIGWVTAKWVLRSALIATTFLLGLAVIVYVGSYFGIV